MPCRPQDNIEEAPKVRYCRLVMRSAIHMAKQPGPNCAGKCADCVLKFLGFAFEAQFPVQFWLAWTWVLLLMSAVLGLPAVGSCFSMLSFASSGGICRISSTQPCDR